ncbi:MAG: riboflavin biosynthesis protein RibF [Deltaproteobacteria bacterium]|jgi:riboflavin kinase/FMN adenylyltransferase|nr:riboflavin biosynthesis protein RibF [Deltaproteobacteria bacterium]
MYIIRDWLNSEPNQKFNAVLTIGVFDGLHLGHQSIVKRIVAEAKRLKAASLLLTFDPHPLAVLSSAVPPEILTTFASKATILKSFGLDVLGRFVFNEAFKDISAQDFFSKVILSRVNPLSIVVGPDFRFGRNAEGNVETLGQLASNQKITLEVVKLLKDGNALYSSSHIRSLLKLGLVGPASKALGRPYRLSGQVARAEGRGRTLGYPTANLENIPQLVPGPGVYAVMARLRGEARAAMTSVGSNPTFRGRRLTVETNIFDFNDDFYGEYLELDFIEFIRGIIRFDGPETLIGQLALDERRAREILSASI